MHVRSLDHIHIHARDPQKSAEFYVHHFEAKEVSRNTEAWMRGNFHLVRNSREDKAEARRWYERALELDADYETDHIGGEDRAEPAFDFGRHRAPRALR